MDHQVNERIIEVKNLDFTYQGADKPALRGINLTVRKGELIGITGANGAGKTTLSYCLNGLIPSFYEGLFAGEVRIKGRSIFDLSIREISQWVGSVFQDPETQLVSANVEEELAFGPENFGIHPIEIEKRINFALKAVGIEGLRHSTVDALSGGQKQRVAIAAVLAMFPEIIILDEPTAELDPVGTDEVFGVLRRLNREFGLTVIIIEHKIEQLAASCDRLLIMDQGRIVFDGAPDEIFRHWREVHKLGVRLPQVTEFFGKYFGSEPRKLPVTLEEAQALAEKLLSVGNGEQDEPNRYY